LTLTIFNGTETSVEVEVSVAICAAAQNNLTNPLVCTVAYNALCGRVITDTLTSPSNESFRSFDRVNLPPGGDVTITAVPSGSVQDYVFAVSATCLDGRDFIRTATDQYEPTAGA
jgi:hypothetical protein